MRPTVILAALCAVLLASSADARPRHHSLHFLQRMNLQETFAGCAGPIGLCFTEQRQADLPVRKQRLLNTSRPIPPGLFAEGISRKSLRHRRFSRVNRREGITHQDTVRPIPPGLHRVMAEGAGRIVAHPRGCPRRAFCGCGASVERFGRSIRSLWLARNWLKFPRAEPAPGRAAVRSDGHHIVILRRHVRGHVWSVYDANSGGHRTRIHPRSIAGWSIVDPRAGT